MATADSPKKDNVSKFALLPALMLAILVFVAGASSFYAPPAQGEMAVVFPFGTSEPAAYALVLAAGGKFVGPSRLPNIIVAFAPDEGFGQRIREAGALFLLAAQGLCGPLPSEPSRA